MHTSLRLAATVMFTLACVAASAQDRYPSKPIRLVVPFAPGGTTDVLARAVSVKMGEELGQSIVVDNKPGAGGNIGADQVAKAAPDGYTLLLGTPGPLAINQSLYKTLPFDPHKDFAPVGQLITIQAVVVAPPNSPFKSMRDVAARAQSAPVQYASAGSGTTPHLAAELYASMAGVQLQHVPYKGDAPALVDVLGGHVGLMFANTAGVMTQIRDGKVKALAVTGPSRSKGMPDVPTIAESGLPGYGVTAWAGFFAPAGTPPAVIARLNAELNKALAAPDVVARMQQLEAEVAPGTPEQLGSLVRSEQQRWAQIIRDRKITAD